MNGNADMIIRESSTATLSVVVPVHNEAGNIAPLIERVSAVLAGNVREWEIIFVNDGSTDATKDAITEEITKDGRILLLNFSRNWGHQAAILAGIVHARGDMVVTMDGDLEHPPEKIPEMIEMWKKGYDVVMCRREEAPERGWFKGVTSRMFYRLFNRLSDIRIEENAADFRLISSKVREVLSSLPEQNLFIRGIIPWIGFSSTSIFYKEATRKNEKSKYSLKRMLSLALGGLVSFSVIPLRLAVIFGAVCCLFSFAYAVWIIFSYFLGYGDYVRGWSTLAVSILFMGGVQLLCLGVLGEYVGRIFIEVKRRPGFIVESYDGKGLVNDNDYNRKGLR